MLVYLLSSSGLFKNKSKNIQLYLVAFVVYSAVFGAMWRIEKTKKYAKYLIPLFIADLVVYKLVLSKSEVTKKSNKTLNSKVKPKLVKGKKKETKKCKKNKKNKKSVSDKSDDIKKNLERERLVANAKMELDKQKRARENLEKLRRLEQERITETAQKNNNDIIDDSGNNNVVNEHEQTVQQEKPQDLESIKIPIYRPIGSN